MEENKGVDTTASTTNSKEATQNTSDVTKSQGNNQGKKSGKKGKNRHGNSNKHNPNDMPKSDGDMKTGADRPGSHNNPRDWGTEDEVRAAAGWAYANRVGTRIPTMINEDVIAINANSPTVTSASMDSNTIPGILGIGIVPTPGVSEDGRSPLNLSAYAINGFLRANVSGSRAYRKQDVIKYTLSMDSVYMLMMWVMRAFLIINNYQKYNAYYPEAIFEAMHLDFEDTNSNIANYIADWNNALSAANSLKVPNVFPYINRHSFMMTNIYKDDELDNFAQLYVFYPMAFFEPNDETGSPVWMRLQDLGMNGTTKHTVRQILSIVRRIVAKLTNDNVMMQIAGDIGRTYGEDNCITVPKLPQDLPTLIPVYDVEMLYTIHHIRFLNGFGSESMGHDVVSRHIVIKDDDPNGSMIWRPSIDAGGHVTGYNVLRNSFYDSSTEIPSADENMTSSRLDPICWYDTDNKRIMLEACGTEVVLKGNMIYYDVNGILHDDVIYNNVFYTLHGGTSIPTEYYIRQLTMLNVFKKGPMMFEVIGSGDATNVGDLTYSSYPLTEVKNVTVVDHATVARAHTQAMLAAYRIAGGFNYSKS